MAFCFCMPGIAKLYRVEVANECFNTYLFAKSKFVVGDYKYETRAELTPKFSDIYSSLRTRKLHINRDDEGENPL